MTTKQTVYTCGTGSLKVEMRRALITSFSASAMALHTQTHMFDMTVNDEWKA